MGDRISISFKNGDEESVALFNHWGGRGFLQQAKLYVRELKAKIGKEHNVSNPIDRLEPETVMVDFIRYLTKDMEIVDSNLYLGKDGSDGDNSDNGHHIIDLKKVK